MTSRLEMRVVFDGDPAVCVCVSDLHHLSG